MNPGLLQRLLVSIVAEATWTESLSATPPDASLLEMGFDTVHFLERLGLAPDAERYASARSIKDLTECLNNEGPQVLEVLRREAALARVRRLLWATLSFTPDLAPIENIQEWWFELASQVLWWHAAEECTQGRELVEAGVPVRATIALINLGLLDMKALSAQSNQDQSDFEKVLIRTGYEEPVAKSARITLSSIAERIYTTYGGKAQRALRNHADRLAEAVSHDLLGGLIEQSSNLKAIGSWISTLTSLPISVLSPSALDFIHKFADTGLTEAFFFEAAEEKQIDFVTIDQATCLFMDGTCRNCDPDNPRHQFCVKKFAPVGWDVECVKQNEE